MLFCGLYKWSQQTFGWELVQIISSQSPHFCEAVMFIVQTKYKKTIFSFEKIYYSWIEMDETRLNPLACKFITRLLRNNKWPITFEQMNGSECSLLHFKADIQANSGMYRTLRSDNSFRNKTEAKLKKIKIKNVLQAKGLIPYHAENVSLEHCVTSIDCKERSFLWEESWHERRESKIFVKFCNFIP